MNLLNSATILRQQYVKWLMSASERRKTNKSIGNEIIRGNFSWVMEVSRTESSIELLF